MPKYVMRKISGGVSFQWRRYLKELSEEEIIECFEIDDPDFSNKWTEDDEEKIALAYAFLINVYVSKSINGIELPKRHFIDPESELGKQCRRAIASLLKSDNPPPFLLTSLARMIEPRSSNRVVLKPGTEDEAIPAPAIKGATFDEPQRICRFVFANKNKPTVCHLQDHKIHYLVEDKKRKILDADESSERSATKAAVELVEEALNSEYDTNFITKAWKRHGVRMKTTGMNI